MIRTAGLMLLICTFVAHAEIYRFLDDDGNVSFSNEPPPGVSAKPVELGPVNTIDSNAPAYSPKGVRAIDNSTAPTYTDFSITTPEDDATIRDNAGNLVVEFDVAPNLSGTHEIVVYIDDVEIASGNTKKISLANVDRGTHSIHGKVKNVAGDILITSNSITFTLLRASVLNRARTNTP